MANRIATLTALFKPAVEAMGCDLWGIEYLSQGKHSLLRVYLDKEGGIDVEDCAQVSRQISSILDVEDPISGEYTLEVSSPGLDRPLFTPAQYEAYAGSHVKLRLHEPFEGKRNFSGLIKGVEDEEIILIVDDNAYTLPFELIEKANIVADI